MSISKKDINELKANGKLPSPTGVALRLMELTQKDDVAIDEIADTVRADPAMTGKLINFANSALTGLRRRPAISAAEAIQRIGLTAVRQLVLGFSVMRGYRSGTCASFDYPGFWSRSLATAIAANALCLRLRVMAAEEAFTCGLLSDLGSLALASLYPKEFSTLIDATREFSPGRRAEAERKQLGLDHNEICAALLGDWKLPKLFLDAVFYYEEPERSPAPPGSREDSLVTLLALAAKLGSYCVASDADRKSKIPVLMSDAANLGLDDQALAMIVDQVMANWVEWGRILEVRTQDLGSFSDMVAAVEASQPESMDSADSVEPLDILVAEDDKKIAEILVRTLTGQGHRVTVAQDGKTALALAIGRDPQLVISDWMMPGMTGVELCRALRQTEHGAGIYFVLVTSLGHEDEVVEAFEAGVDDYLTKPFNPKILTARLRASTRMVRLRAESQKAQAESGKYAMELAVTQRRLQQAALIDPLTGLPSRQHVLERAAKERDASIQNGTPLSVMVIDIDLLRQVNRTYGYANGDEVLRQIAGGLRKWARAGDVVGRWGDDAFVVICPGADLPLATLLADRQRQAVANQVMKVMNASLRVTASIGVAEHLEGHAGMEDMFNGGEAAMQRAKTDGGNRVQVAASAGGKAGLH